MAGWPTGRDALLQDRAEQQQRFQLAGRKSEDTDPDWAFTLIRESDSAGAIHPGKAASLRSLPVMTALMGPQEVTG